MNSNQQFQPNPNMGSGLTRYRSAPSSYFASLDDGGFGADDFAELFNPRASSPETQIIFSRFMNGGAAVEGNFAAAPPRELEAEEYQPPQKLQRNQSNDYSMNSNCAVQAKMESGGAGNSGLIRHSSLPAGFLANISIGNEFKTTSAVGSYGGGKNANAEASFSSTTRRMDYSSTGMMDPISTAGKNAAVGDEDHDFMTSLAWDDSAFLSDHYLKGVGENENKRFTLKQEEETPKTMLSHHLSLPKSLAMEKLLQDSVPCKIRAKRGFATHPRSIAERVRRTKISERIRKLQELVPNMEKQTNTSDMLDLAVDYIKELQGQVKTLSDNQTKCSCSAKQR